MNRLRALKAGRVSVRGAVCTAALLAGLALVGGLGATPPSWSQAAQPAQRPQRVHAKLDGFDAAPNANKVNQVGGASRGLGGVTLYAPHEGKAYSLTPTFLWAADDPQATYLFKLALAADPQNPLLTGKTTGGAYTYPADAPALEPGKTYIFTVQPENDMLGGAASAKLKVVGGKEREEIAAALAAAATSTEPERARAQVLTDKRLWFDAVDAYTRLIAEHPDQRELYAARADIYDQLPQTRALAAADEARGQP